MRTTFVMDPPPIVEDWLAERRALAQDLYDEVWEGEYHVAPAPTWRHADVQAQLLRILEPLAHGAGLRAGGPGNLGEATDYRVPDLAFLRHRVVGVRTPSAAIVVEVLSPNDDSRLKSDFYFRHDVEEMLIVDPDARTVEWFERGADAFRPADGSTLLAISTTELAAAIDWPA
jgi:Uma2 family endonuclease